MSPHRFHDPAGSADADVRDALHDAVDDVHPHEALATIRARVEEREREQPRRHGWAGVSLATAAATVLVIGGVVGVNQWNHAQGGSGPPAARPVGHAANLSTYSLGRTAAGPRLFHENRHVTGITGSDLQAAVNDTLGAPLDPDYYSAFPEGTRATVTDYGDYVQVDLTGADLTQLPPAGRVAAEMGLQAVAWTVVDTVQRPVPVRFTIDGSPAHTLLGIHPGSGVTRSAADSVLSPVSISLREGQRVASGTRILGQAAAYEGTVLWQLAQDGRVVEHGVTTAGQCCTLATYAFRLTAPPGHYVLSVRDTSGSGLEGVGTTTDTKDIVVD